MFASFSVFAVITEMSSSGDEILKHDDDRSGVKESKQKS